MEKIASHPTLVVRKKLMWRWMLAQELSEI
jgi:hypothetical protein